MNELRHFLLTHSRFSKNTNSYWFPVLKNWLDNQIVLEIPVGAVFLQSAASLMSFDFPSCFSRSTSPPSNLFTKLSCSSAWVIGLVVTTRWLRGIGCNCNLLINWCWFWPDGIPEKGNNCENDSSDDHESEEVVVEEEKEQAANHCREKAGGVFLNTREKIAIV